MLYQREKTIQWPQLKIIFSSTFYSIKIQIKIIILYARININRFAFVERKNSCVVINCDFPLRLMSQNEFAEALKCHKNLRWELNDKRNWWQKITRRLLTLHNPIINNQKSNWTTRGNTAYRNWVSWLTIKFPTHPWITEIFASVPTFACHEKADTQIPILRITCNDCSSFEAVRNPYFLIIFRKDFFSIVNISIVNHKSGINKPHIKSLLLIFHLVTRSGSNSGIIPERRTASSPSFFFFYHFCLWTTWLLPNFPSHQSPPPKVKKSSTLESSRHPHRHSCVNTEIGPHR